METLVNSPIATEFDPHTLPFTPSDPLLNSVGINHLAMIRLLHDHCPEFAQLVRKAKVQSVSSLIMFVTGRSEIRQFNWGKNIKVTLSNLLLSSNLLLVGCCFKTFPF